MTNVTTHATERLGDRVSREAQAQAQAYFEWAWNLAQPLTRRDCTRLKIARKPGFKYRLLFRHGGQYLIVRDRDGKFVTIIKKQ